MKEGKEEEKNYHLYHSGVVNNTGRHGVAIALRINGSLIIVKERRLYEMKC